MKIFLILSGICCYFLLGAESFPERENSTLILTHILFRHGDRTPKYNAIFLKGVYKNETFSPFGFGELTLVGKHKAYSLGVALRMRYKDFLGPIYFKELIQATSSMQNRAVMSLQAVLAGLFPPSKELQIAEGLDWQPVVYKILDGEQDQLLNVFKKCKPTSKVEELDEKTKEVYEYLSEYIGSNVTNMVDALRVHHTLKIMKNLNYDLPEWANAIWPEPLRSIGLRSWKDLIDTKLPIISGHLLKKIVGDTKQKIAGTLEPKQRKIFMYSGHDANIVGMLGSLGIYDGREVNFSAYILIEVHEINGVFGIKVFYENYDGSEPEAVSLANCGTFCPLEMFEEIVMKYYPKTPWCY